ncbi:MAG TPA: hypothetical protein VFW87_13250 [Pirellulales bacterium]|nr:hypothetical protein [Pirellulales bacterium]
MLPVAVAARVIKAFQQASEVHQESASDPKIELRFSAPISAKIRAKIPDLLHVGAEDALDTAKATLRNDVDGGRRSLRKTAREFKNTRAGEECKNSRWSAVVFSSSTNRLAGKHLPDFGALRRGVEFA